MVSAAAWSYPLTQTPPHLPFSDGRHLAVWRCLLCQDHSRASSSNVNPELQMERLRQLASPSPASSAGPLWVILMLRGGHFAAAVLRAKAPPPAQGGGGGGGGAGGSGGRSLLDPAAEPFEVVDHKTFHRYVVRCEG